MFKSLLRKSVLPLGLLGSLAAAGSAHASEWEVDPAHTTATFAVRHMMVTTVKGSFEKVNGTVALDDANPTRSKIEFAIDAASINTRNEQRDGHLKSPDFFDVAKHPKATFVSTEIVPGGEKGASHTVTGNFTLHGVTKSIKFPAKIAVTDGSAKVDSEFFINRKDFGIVYPGQANNLIRDEVVIKLALNGTKPSGQ